MNALVFVSNGQRSPAGWAEIAVNKVIQISNDVDPALRNQAHVFKTRIEQVFANYIRMAVEEERAFTATFLEQNGAAEMAQVIRSKSNG